MKTIECSNKSLKKMFSVEDWAALNATKDDYEILKMDHNLLENIDVQFPTLRFPLKVVDFRHNKINQIVKNCFTNLNYLEEIDLSFNEMKSENLKPEIFEGKYSPDEYEPLMSLKRLRLSYNLLHNLDTDIFEHIKHLQELYLDNNPFQIIHTNVLGAFSDLPQLQLLDMSRMELSTLPEDTFHPLRALKVLKLEGNLFTTIPQALKWAINVQELSLDENPIGDLTGENKMPPMPKLEKLNMTFMGSLHVIGMGAFGGLENLKELQLAHNHHLTYIHPSAFSFWKKDDPERELFPKVEKLFLNNNNLSSLDHHMLVHWQEMKEVHLHENPW
jgi:Leucine-rich repeat (LRR) protein